MPFALAMTAVESNMSVFGLSLLKTLIPPEAAGHHGAIRSGIVNLTICDRVGAGDLLYHAATEAHAHASNELARRSL